MNANNPDWLTVLNREVIACTRCPRLVVYREQVAREKRRAYRECEYWGKPVPGFGDPEARVLIMGLAPGAHGSNPVSYTHLDVYKRQDQHSSLGIAEAGHRLAPILTVAVGAALLAGHLLAIDNQARAAGRCV